MMSAEGLSQSLDALIRPFKRTQMARCLDNVWIHAKRQWTSNSLIACVSAPCCYFPCSASQDHVWVLCHVSGCCGILRQWLIHPKNFVSSGIISSLWEFDKM